MNEFLIGMKKYSWISVQDAMEHPEILPENKIYKKTKYLDIGCGFDIETTNFQKNDRWYATMYIWQFSMDEITIIGHSWEEFASFIQFLKSYYSLDEKERKLIILIHNMNFEFSFMRKWIPINSIMAKSRREVMIAKSEGIEFRDSAIITHMSLANMAKSYKLGIDKLKGDLDYSVLRISGEGYHSPLSNEEMAYCINDVQILQKFFHKYLKPYFLRNGYKVPLTQTSIPRLGLKRGLRKEVKDFIVKFRARIKRAMPSEEFYLIMRKYLFRGGYVHASNLVINETFEENENDVEFAGFDRTSSYPASIFQRKMPWEYTKVFPVWFYENCEKDEDFFEDHGFVVYLTISKICAKGPHSIESKHKLVNYSEDAIFDNGRLLKASQVEVVLNEFDWMNYRNFYEFEKIKCEWVFISEKEYLPEFVIKTVYEYYKSKQIMPKGDARDREKEKLNGIYGCMVTGLPSVDMIFHDGEVLPSDDPSLPDEIRQEPKSYDELVKRLILLPQWGITISAASRYELLKLISICPYDSLYADTDSDKIRNYKKYIPEIEKYNQRMEEMNLAACERWNLDFEILRGLGKFIQEDGAELKRFKTLGAKRYLYEVKENPEKKIKGKIVATVAGMEKGSFLEWCKEKEKDPFEAFNDNLYLDQRFAHKITSSYQDEEFTFELTDFQGVTKKIYEKSCCALFAIPFSMKIDKDFLTLCALLKIKEDRRREIYNGIL